MRLCRPVVFAVGFLLASAGGARADFLMTDWGSSGNANLYRLSTGTGAATLIGSTGQPRMIGLVVDADSTIYTVSEETNSGLWRLNPTTGAATLVGRLGFNLQEGDMTINPATGQLYVSNGAGDNLYTVNKATGAATLVGSFGAQGRDVSGLQFINGTLYGLALRDSSTDLLVTVNPATGLATAVGAGTGTNFGVIAGMGRDPSDGIVYIAGPTSDFGNNNQLWSLNLSTGVASFVRNITGVTASVSGFSVAGNPSILNPSATAIPEPATFAVLGAGLIGLAFRRGRK